MDVSRYGENIFDERRHLLFLMTRIPEIETLLLARRRISVTARLQ